MVCVILMSTKNPRAALTAEGMAHPRSMQENADMQDNSTIALHPRTQNLLGKPPFGRLTVIAFAGYVMRPSGYRQALWQCQCQEGNLVIVRARDLLNGNTSSCGCLRQETAAIHKTIHGKSHTREFFIWWNMLERCEKPTNKAYGHYGGRGI